MIWLHQSGGSDYHYNGEDLSGERHYTNTVITALVAGETEFTLHVYTYRPAGATLPQQGGSFLPDREAIGLWPESDFFLYGTLEDVGGPPITGDAAGNFHVVGEASDFVNWADSNFVVSVESGQTMMQTILDTGKGYHYTTSPSNNAQADLDIVFRFDQPLVTCQLDYGTVIDESQSSDAFVQIEVTAKRVKTLIYFHQEYHTGQELSYNYTPEGGVPNGVDGDAERCRAYTLIDDLVAGETEFTLHIAVYFGSMGDPAGGTGLNQGGSFLPDREEATPSPLWPESDFILSGTMRIAGNLFVILR